MSAEEIDWDVPTVALTDESGKELKCYVEHTTQVEGNTYALLHPVDAPIEIVTWPDEDEDSEPIPLDDDADLQAIFPTAKAVLSEENLILKDTAVVLTVEGDLSEILDDDEEEGEPLNGEVEDEVEELRWLASFFHEDQEYAIYTPLDPFFILARLDEHGHPHLLPPEEFKRIEGMLPALEETFFQDL